MQRLALLMLLGLGLAPQVSVPAHAQQQQAATLVSTGHYVWNGGEEERSALHRAIDKATASMSIFTRGIARDRLREGISIPRAHAIALDEQTIAVESGSGLVSAPRDGRAIKWKNRQDKEFKVVHRVVNGKVEQRFVSEDGSRTNVFWMSGDQLVVDVTVSAPRLPQDVTFRLTYKRAS